MSKVSPERNKEVSPRKLKRLFWPVVLAGIAFVYLNAQPSADKNKDKVVYTSTQGWKFTPIEHGSFQMYPGAVDAIVENLITITDKHVAAAIQEFLAVEYGAYVDINTCAAAAVELLDHNMTNEQIMTDISRIFYEHLGTGNHTLNEVATHQWSTVSDQACLPPGVALTDEQIALMNQPEYGDESAAPAFKFELPDGWEWGAAGITAILLLYFGLKYGGPRLARGVSRDLPLPSGEQVRAQIEADRERGQRLGSSTEIEE